MLVGRLACLNLDVFFCGRQGHANMVYRVKEGSTGEADLLGRDGQCSGAGRIQRRHGYLLGYGKGWKFGRQCSHSWQRHDNNCE